MKPAKMIPLYGSMLAACFPTPRQHDETHHEVLVVDGIEYGIEIPVKIKLQLTDGGGREQLFEITQRIPVSLSSVMDALTKAQQAEEFRPQCPTQRDLSIYTIRGPFAEAPSECCALPEGLFRPSLNEKLIPPPISSSPIKTCLDASRVMVASTSSPPPVMGLPPHLAAHIQTAIKPNEIQGVSSPAKIAPPLSKLSGRAVAGIAVAASATVLGAATFVYIRRRYANFLLIVLRASESADDKENGVLEYVHHAVLQLPATATA